MAGYFDKGKKTRRETFLAQMDPAVPWARLCALIESHLKTSPAGGRTPLPMEQLFRIYSQQQWYNLSERGLLVVEGAIVDTSIFDAASSTKNAGKKRDPKMHQTRKDKQWHFGMKVHIGVDTDSGLVHTLRRRQMLRM